MQQSNATTRQQRSIATAATKKTNANSKRNLFRRLEWRRSYPCIFLQLVLLRVVTHYRRWMCLQLDQFVFPMVFGQTPEEALWRGEFYHSKKKHSSDRENNHRNIDIVVSHCDRSVGWIWRFTRGTSIRSVTIHSKCGVPVKGIPWKYSHKVTVQTHLANVGRCDHTYAHWLAEQTRRQTQQQQSADTSYAAATDEENNTNTNNNKDIVIFLKDNSNRHRSLFFRRRSLREMISIADEHGFACHEHWWWWHGNRKSGTTTSNMQAPFCLTSYYHNTSLLEQFHLPGYTRLGRDDNNEFQAPYKNLGHWLDEMTHESTTAATTNSSSSTTRISKPRPEIVPGCYGGNFLFRKSQMYQNPHFVYQNMEQSLSRGNNIVEGHYAERSWAFLLSKPLTEEHTKTLQQMASLDPSCHPSYGGKLTFPWDNIGV